MSNVIDTVSREVMIEDGCGMTEHKTGERVLCDDERLCEVRESKCNCRSSAKAAIRATLAWYRDNPSLEMLKADPNTATCDVSAWAKDKFKAMLSQAIKELDEGE